MRRITRPRFLLFAFLSLIAVAHLACEATDPKENASLLYREIPLPCGGVIREPGSNSHPDPAYGFADYEQDDDLQLHDAGARMYSTVLCRFTGIDPVDDAGRDPFAYARNNPLRYRDPDGRFPIQAQVWLHILQAATQKIRKQVTGAKGLSLSNVVKSLFVIPEDGIESQESLDMQNAAKQLTREGLIVALSLDELPFESDFSESQALNLSEFLQASLNFSKSIAADSMRVWTGEALSIVYVDSLVWKTGTPALLVPGEAPGETDTFQVETPITRSIANAKFTFSTKTQFGITTAVLMKLLRSGEFSASVANQLLDDAFRTVNALENYYTAHRPRSNLDNVYGKLYNLWKENRIDVSALPEPKP